MDHQGQPSVIFDKDTMVFIQETAIENIVCEMVEHLFQCMCAEELDWRIRPSSSHISLQATHWLSLKQLNLS